MASNCSMRLTCGVVVRIGPAGLGFSGSHTPIDLVPDEVRVVAEPLQHGPRTSDHAGDVARQGSGQVQEDHRRP